MYRVRLDQFEGPLDLLLFFVRRDEIDVYDIPIARIADEFLEYVRLMEKVDLDGVGDFIYMAALLVRIKAQMLLPSEEAEGEDETEDPRRELIERLLEYVRFKEASEQLRERRARRAGRFTRGEADVEEERWGERREVEVDASVYDLMSALGDILIDRPEDEELSFDIEPFGHTVEEQQEWVVEQLQSGREMAFQRLVRRRSKAFVIATFLAVLELARQRRLRLQLEEEGSGFHVAGRLGASDTPPPVEDEGRQNGAAVNGAAVNGAAVNGAPE